MGLFRIGIRGSGARRRRVRGAAFAVSVLVAAAVAAGYVASAATSRPTSTQLPQSPQRAHLARANLHASHHGGGTQTQGGQGGGGGLKGNPSHHQSGLYTGPYSRALARCMRNHRIRAFPNYKSGEGSLHDRGVDTFSAAFQKALYGPCKSLAPASWVSAPPLGPPTVA